MTPKTGRRRGRPAMPLNKREGRYLFAIFEAKVQRAKERGMSEFLAFEAIAFMLRSDIVAASEPGGFEMVRSTDYRDPKDAAKKAEQHRYGKPDRAFGDDLRRTVRRFRKNPDATWFLPMVASYRLCIDGELERAVEARALAASAGEEAHFEAVMLPYMRECRALRDLARLGYSPPWLEQPLKRISVDSAAQIISMPDLFPKDGRGRM
jgi:hypothetical protein